VLAGLWQTGEDLGTVAALEGLADMLIRLMGAQLLLGHLGETVSALNQY